MSPKIMVLPFCICPNPPDLENRATSSRPCCQLHKTERRLLTTLTMAETPLLRCVVDMLCNLFLQYTAVQMMSRSTYRASRGPNAVTELLVTTWLVSVDEVKKVKVAHTRLPSVGFRS